jgi:hypothetical protein
MTFDLSDPDEALTYARLKDSSRRACRVSIDRQAEYLLMVMVGVRMFQSLKDTGLEEVPNFPAQVTAFNKIMKRAVRAIAGRMVEIEGARNGQPVHHSKLRSPQLSGRA